MTASRRELMLVLAMTVGPAILLIADASLYSRSASLLAVPASAAILLLVLGAVAIGRKYLTEASFEGRPEKNWPSLSLRQALYVFSAVLALILIGPRIALPLFGVVFARALGANWIAAFVTGAACAAVVELFLVRFLEQPLPWLPALSWLGT